jgi:hypothetical protein
MASAQPAANDGWPSLRTGYRSLLVIVPIVLHRSEASPSIYPVNTAVALQVGATHSVLFARGSGRAGFPRSFS